MTEERPQTCLVGCNFFREAWAIDEWINIDCGLREILNVPKTLQMQAKTPKSPEHRFMSTWLTIFANMICWIGIVFRKKMTFCIKDYAFIWHLKISLDGNLDNVLEKIIKTVWHQTENVLLGLCSCLLLCFQLIWFQSNGSSPKIYINNKYSEKYRFPGVF